MPAASGLMPLFLKCGNPTHSDFPLHTHGETPSAGTPYAIMPLVVSEGANSTGINDNITLFIKQGLHPSGLITLYTSGTTSTGFIKSNALSLLINSTSPSGSMDLYIKGLGNTSHSQAGLTDSDGFNFFSETMPLTIQRDYEGTSATTKLFIEGQQTRTSTSSIPLFTMTPSGTTTGTLKLVMNGSQPSGTLNLYTRGF